MEPKESVIRLMTRLAMQHKAVNLSQGFTDEAPFFGLAWSAVKAMLGGTDEGFERLEGLTLEQIARERGQSPEAFLKTSLRQVLEGVQSKRDRFNQYSFPFGLPELRRAVSEYTERFYGFHADPEKEITIVLGATEGLSTLLRSTCNPGDGVIIFQPFHEMYPAQCNLFGLHPQYVTLREDRASGTWEMDREEVRRAVDASTKAIILNTPHNPTGKVFPREDLQFLADLCIERNLFAITDEIYEHIEYDGHRHLFLAGLPGMKERTFVINSISKTGSATGWRVGWVISPAAHTTRLRGIHDTLVIQAPTPLQRATVDLLQQDRAFFDEVGKGYQRKRELLLRGLREAGFHVSAPEGAYYFFADYRGVPAIRSLPPMDAAMYLIEKVGVASVPGDNFYKVGREGDDYLRFAFCRSLETLEEGVRRFRKHLA
ncbi:MAG TPA: aminotransferase class I/II-fold pyridoxal phosphate-dependent enzyme [Myxococcales bacterium]